ncbi:MAG: GAF domain-containing protein [Chitinophagales bacterium]
MKKQTFESTPENMVIETPNFHNHFHFPYKTTLSFAALISALEQKAMVPDNAEEIILKEILRTVKAAHELNNPIEDLEVIKKFRKEIDILMTTVAPLSISHDELRGAIIPFQPVTVFGTKKFNELIISDENGIWNLGNVDGEAAVKELVAFAGAAILQKYYGVKMEHPDIFKNRVLDKVTGSATVYKPEIFTEFVEVKALKEPKPLKDIDLSPLKKNFFDHEFWLKNFPPDTFAFEGVTIYRMVDISDREMITSLEYTLLQTGSIISAKNILEISEKMRGYFKIPNLKVGLAPMFNYRGKMAACGETNWFCFVPFTKMKMLFENFERSVYSHAIKLGDPLLIEDLEKISSPSPVEEELLAHGLRCMIIVPIFHQKELIGAIEFGTPEPDTMNFITLMKLKEIMPLIHIAFKRAADDFDIRVQAAIKENYTSIHPSVEWKFAEAVLQQIGKGEIEQSELPLIECKDVTPVYGQIDIRSSSGKRNEAIRQDMIDYLVAAKQLLHDAYKEYPFTILDELTFRIETYKNKLKDGLDSGDEFNILDFMRTEVEPVLNMVAEKSEKLRKPVKIFFDSLDPEHAQHHMRRKEFEESLNMLNDTVVSMLDEEEERTQKLLPHYFEKYKTDGVEYNIYLGQSIMQDGKFEPVFVKNFRLWQLVTMASIARETNRLLPTLPMPLETTQLILCYSNPFSIVFRMDEKRFDVSGAYNIRYEIVKKRIDKAHVKDTEQRITQPHTIAIIYTQDKEANEYERYFEYLKSKGLIKDEIEYLEVEQLQGLQGLKAMRIHVNYEPEDPKLDLHEEELFKNIKGELV